jgi:hypothetical protein
VPAVALESVAGTRPVACPDCGVPVQPATERLCHNCGYPLLFMRPERLSTGRAVPRIPGEADDPTTGWIRPVAPVPYVDERPPGPGLRCPRCAHVSAPTRVRCERCGLDLRTPFPATVYQPEPRRSRRGRRIAIALTAVALTGVMAAATVLFVRTALRDPVPAPAAAPSGVLSTSPGGRLVQVDPASVTASASSSIPAPRFAPGNTLDGDRTTAWHSDGRKVPNTIGITLSFRFNRPVRLARIAIVSGFARSTTDYTNNQRMARASVQTDAGTKSWKLADTWEVQSLDLDPAPVTSVTFVVEEVYLGTRYKDVTVSEVVFSELR